MALIFNNAIEVFIFIIFCSVYVCSILWIYGDAIARDMGFKSVLLPVVFILIAGFYLLEGTFWVLYIWLIIYTLWFMLRPKNSHAVTE